MQEYTISKLSQYIDAIEQLKSYYPNKVMANNPAALTFLYRGLSNSSHQLLPGIFRRQKDPVGVGEREVENDTYLAFTTERGILQAFIQEASSIVSIPSGHLSEWAEYAQHYGAPTRLLDWSSNPFVALYFACKNHKKTDGCVWMLHAKNYERIPVNPDLGEQKKTRREIIGEIISGSKDYPIPILYTPNYVDARMSAQSSYFMVWGSNREPFEKQFSDEKYRMKLPETDSGIRSVGQHEMEALLFRFHIHGDRKQTLLRELDAVGINEKTLFPGLDGIGRYVERTYRFDYNEAVENF